MTSEEHPKTFLNWILDLLDERFPWLGSKDEPDVAGADTVDELVDLYRSLVEERSKFREPGEDQLR